MTMKTTMGILAGKASHFVLSKLGRGSTLPGKIALKFDKDILDTLAKDYEIVVVTGTNGKTLTTALTVGILKEAFGEIVTNPSGANMITGITSTFLTAKKAKSGKKIAVLEIDEASLPKITEYITPSLFVFTNIFRDQMDRYGEIYTTYDKIVNGIKLAPDATIIANGDASIFSSVELPNKKIFYGFKLPDDKPENDFKAPVNTDGVLCPKCDHILHYHERIYANLGDFFCPNCGYHRPDLTFTVNKIIDQTPNSSTFQMGNKQYSINIGGTYNIYNALAAYSVARHFGLTEAEVAQAFAENKRIFGRQELIHYGDKDIDLILVKNPVGLDEVLHMLNTEKDDYSLVALLNANHADGIDTSWIWDADFEGLDKEKIKKILVGGQRWHDMGFRLEIAGFDPGQMSTNPDDDSLIEEIKKLPTKKVYILSTYTAMLALRKKMAEKKIIKAGM